MSADKFLEWCLAPEREDEKWELVRGVPVQMMTGATKRHDRILRNTLFALMSRLRGGPCEPTTDDIALKTEAGESVRRPDITVDCGAYHDKALAAEAPTAAFEILSRSTEKVTRTTKVEEFKRVATMKHIVLIEQLAPRALMYTRMADGVWSERLVDGLDATLSLSGLGVEIPLSEVYVGVAFAEEPGA